jgi:hypothetical protein
MKWCKFTFPGSKFNYIYTIIQISEKKTIIQWYGKNNKPNWTYEDVSDMYLRKNRIKILEGDTEW